jgi:small subunit ribosomal protein S9
MNLKKYYGTGRRKTASARVWIKKGSGLIQINNKAVENYFPLESLIETIQKPLAIVNFDKEFDIVATSKGGGLSGQAGAISHGLVRAILSYDEKYKPLFKKQKLTTRDSRSVERKKCGQAGARKKFQYSKR